MKHKKLIGAVLLIIGAVLLITGLSLLILTNVSFSVSLIFISILFECAGITIMTWKSPGGRD